MKIFANSAGWNETPPTSTHRRAPLISRPDARDHRQEQQDHARRARACTCRRRAAGRRGSAAAPGRARRAPRGARPPARPRPRGAEPIEHRDTQPAEHGRHREHHRVGAPGGATGSRATRRRWRPRGSRRTCRCRGAPSPSVRARRRRTRRARPPSRATRSPMPVLARCGRGRRDRLAHAFALLLRRLRGGDVGADLLDDRVGVLAEFGADALGERRVERRAPQLASAAISVTSATECSSYPSGVAGIPWKIATFPSATPTYH